MPAEPLLQSHLPGHEAKRGKVRDVYDLGENLLIVATDRISAFDWVLSSGIPDKGRLLTQLSAHWFKLLAQRVGVGHHLITSDVDRMGLPAGTDLEPLRGRSMLCRKARVLPFECVARGYLAGSAWSEYQASGAACGVVLEEGLAESCRLSAPIFTPATKAEQGEHDENVTLDRMRADLGSDLADRLRDLTLELYACGAAIALERGILVADTKFEFGWVEAQEEPILIDEVLTPDSSRFWRVDDYRPGRAQAAYDKQYLRDWLLASDWDRNSAPPPIPPGVVERTREKYVEAYEALTGERFD